MFGRGVAFVSMMNDNWNLNLGTNLVVNLPEVHKYLLELKNRQKNCRLQFKIDETIKLRYTFVSYT